MKKTSNLDIVDKSYARIPRVDCFTTADDLREVEKLFDGDYKIPLNFKRTAVPQNAFQPGQRHAFYYRNPQTKEFCERLDISDINRMLCEANMNVVVDPYYLSEGKC